MATMQNPVGILNTCLSQYFDYNCGADYQCRYKHGKSEFERVQGMVIVWKITQSSYALDYVARWEVQSGTA